MQQHVRKYFVRPLPPPPNLGVGSVGQNSTFPEYVHIAYQFKKGSRMQQDGSKYFACRPPIPPTLLTLGMGSISRISTSSGHNHAIYQIKGNNEMQQHGSKYFACRHPPSDPVDGVNRSNFNYFRTWSCCNSS